MKGGFVVVAVVVVVVVVMVFTFPPVCVGEKNGCTQTEPPCIKHTTASKHQLFDGTLGK